MASELLQGGALLIIGIIAAIFLFVFALSMKMSSGNDSLESYYADKNKLEQELADIKKQINSIKK